MTRRQGCASDRRPRRARRPSAQSLAPVRSALIAAILLAACDHSAPFTPPDMADLGPRAPGNPVRVTYNVGTDLRPSWLSDGSGFFYSMERADRPDRDRCLALMAANGGTVREQICDRSATSDDSIARFEWAAAAADGRFAYLRAGTPVTPPTLAPRTEELRVGTRAAPDGASARAFPYTAPSGRVHHSLSWLQWLGATRLVYLAEDVRYESPCPSCSPDTLRLGIEVVLIDPASGVLGIVPGTDGATSLAVAGSDTIYYTRDSANVVERRVLSSGVVSAAHDFGEVVQDVTVGGARLAAVTASGALWLVQPGGAATPLTTLDVAVFRRPALSPDGRHLVVEGYPTIVSRSADLWLFELP